MNTLNRSFLNHLTVKERQAALAFVDKVCQQFGQELRAVILFGSRARGEAESDSDMDILVVISDVDPEVQKTIHYLAADVWLEYDIFLSTLVWSEAHQRKVKNLHTLLYQNILRGRMSLLTRFNFLTFQPFNLHPQTETHPFSERGLRGWHGLRYNNRD